jgi:tRNA dimethylallyltransferase
MPQGSAPDSATPPLVVIVGPTASGKTELALALAEREAVEVVSADSVQVYRHFDRGTGKPSTEERARLPHHLIDVVEPSESFDAARFAEAAAERIAEIESRGKRPIVCGGSFLWVRALLYGLASAPRADPALRARHRELAEREGAAALHARLLAVDPASAARLAPADVLRVSRALEVYELGGTPLSALQADHGFRSPRYRARLVAPKRERLELDDRIRARVEAMLDAGWIDEVRALLEAGFGGTRPMGAVGYRQIAEALGGRASLERAPLADAIARATRIFARRQRTWLRDAPVEWVTAL